MYFKVKSILQSNGATCSINIIKYHGEKDGDYGKQYEYDIKCDGEDMKWMASDNQQKRITQLGKASFIIKRWDKGEKTGFEFHASDDVNVQKQNVVSQPSHQDQRDETQERIIRGMCFNNACSLLSQKNIEDSSHVKKVALSLYELMNEWLRTGNEKEEKPTTDVKTDDSVDVKVDDLPF